MSLLLLRAVKFILSNDREKIHKNRHKFFFYQSFSIGCLACVCVCECACVCDSLCWPSRNAGWADHTVTSTSFTRVHSTVLALPYLVLQCYAFRSCTVCKHFWDNTIVQSCFTQQTQLGVLVCGWQVRLAGHLSCHEVTAHCASV